MNDRNPPSARPDGRAELGEAYLRHVSHELRASLNTIVGWVELMRAREFAPETSAQAADVIARHTYQQTWLIECVLDAWRLSLGELHLETAPTDPRQVVESAISIVERSAGSRNISLECRHDANGWRIQGDISRLRLLVVSLLMNVVHFAPARARVCVTAEGVRRRVRITVADAADGPRPSVTASRREQFGAGLSLVRELARLHGGRFTVHDRGAGVIFRVSLPATPPPPAARDWTPAS